jgi:hypothetical protein
VDQVVVLSLEDGSTCGGAGCCSGAGATVRVPVLTCADALRAGGTQVEIVSACSDAEIDTALKTVIDNTATLVVAAADDGQLRAVLRRMVRVYAPPPSKRPEDLPADRTVPDLPPIGVLPLAPARPELVSHLGLPTDPAGVAAAVAGGRTRRFDLLRHDGGSVTLQGVLIGAMDEAQRAVPWRGRVEVGDAVLSDGNEPVLACAVMNAGSSTVDGLPLVQAASAQDGLVEVAVAVPVGQRRFLRRPELHFEVRRARGRAVSVLPHADSVPLLDDGVSGELTRKRSWWVEPGLWAAYVA